MRPTDEDMKRIAEALRCTLERLEAHEGLPLDIALAGLHAEIVATIAARHGGPVAARLFLDAARRLADLPSAARRDLARMQVQGRA